MSDAATMPADAIGATDRASWLARIDEIGEEAGYFQPLGAAHWAFFSDDGPNLLVTFETMDAIRARVSDQLPMGHGIAAARGWSHLCIICDGPTWFRDPAVYRFFDRQVDDAFMEDFDRVVFYGAGMAGYAACSYSVTAPGATVVAVAPRATLDPAVTGWDTRDHAQRRLNFTDRYGYAPDMVDGAGDVFLVLDPHVVPDAMHAALFRKPYVRQLRVPHLGEATEAALLHMGLLPKVLDAACDGTLNRKSFARMWRDRRNFGPYLKQLLAQTDAAEKPHRSAMICRNVAERMNAPRFRRRLAEIEGAAKVAPESS